MIFWKRKLQYIFVAIITMVVAVAVAVVAFAFATAKYAQYPSIKIWYECIHNVRVCYLILCVTDFVVECIPVGIAFAN